MILFDTSLDQLPQQLVEAAAHHLDHHLGIMLPAELAPSKSVQSLGAAIFPWGNWSEPEELARNLYSGLRALDAQNCTVILCPMPADSGVGAAIRDRLRKSAR